MKEKYIIKECKHHGSTEFVLEGRNAYRCKRCRIKSVSSKRKNIKRKLVETFGGKCIVCGYSNCIEALEFHHLDRSTKAFGLASKGLCRSFEKTLEEAKKCALVCANCHREIEIGLVDILKHIIK